MESLENRDIKPLVDIDSKQSANETALAPVIGRRPGKPKGHPKPPGSGRQKGQRNRVTVEIKELAQLHGPKMLRALVQLAEKSPDDKVRLAAQREVLDRAYGRPMTPQEITGKDGAPLNPVSEMSDVEAARRINFLFAKQLHAQGFSVGKDGAITDRNHASTSTAPSTDRRAEIEAARAVMAAPPHAATDPTPQEVEEARQAREAERYHATRIEEQGLGEHNQFNVLRFKPNGR